MDRFRKETLPVSGGHGDPSEDLQTCKLLYIDLQKKGLEAIENPDELVTALLNNIINNEHSDRLVLEMACKVYFLLLTKKYGKIDLKSVEMKGPRAANYIIRGILATDISFVNPDLLYNIILEAIDQCLINHSIYTTIALNNLRLFCNSYKNFPFDFRHLWRIVALHLSSRFTGAREESLSILEFIIKFDQKFAQEIAHLVANSWPWTYANKFYVLSTIIDGFLATNCNLLKQLHLDDGDVTEGLLMALRYKILYSPGQLLFRSLIRKDQKDVIHPFIDRVTESKSTLHIYHVQWSKEMLHHWKDNHRYDQAISSDSNCIMLNTFKERIYDHKYSCPDHRDLPPSPAEDPVEKQHYFDLLQFHISKQWSLTDDLKRMILFLGELRQEQDTTLRQHVLSAFGHFLATLIKLYWQPSPDHKNAIKFFFKELLHQIIHPGFRSSDPSYSEIILSIRLFEVFLRTVYAKNKSIKSAVAKETEQFQGVMSQMYYGLSEYDFDHLLPQLSSPFDDVRQLAIKIILEYFPATNKSRDKIQNAFCEQMYFSSFDESCRVHGYFKVLVPYYVTLKLNIPELYQEYKALLVDNYENRFRNDPLKSIRCGIHIFDKINIVQEIVAAGKLRKDELLTLVRLLLDISQRMLHFLSLASGSEDDVTPSFQVIDESLQVLVNNSELEEGKEWNLTIDQSVMDKEEYVRSRKDLLLSIWMTLKACGDLAAKITELCDGTEDPEIFSLSLKINTDILHRCRHKGAIEAVGLSFGRIVAHVSSSKEFLSAYQQLDECLRVLFESITAASYSRRGAGYSILVLNLIRNDRQPGRPLLQKMLRNIFKEPTTENDSLLVSVNGAFLHYLSALVLDSSLTQDILPHLNEIVTLCLEKIESPDWNVRNAALQLFGSLVPKIIGQRQYSETEWEPCQFTIAELQATMPKIYSFMEFCVENHQKISRTLLIAVLTFLSSVEYRRISTTNEAEDELPIQMHLFRLLGHPVEKVRSLAAMCFARLHPHKKEADLAVKLMQLMFEVRNPNLQHGIIMTMTLVHRKAQLVCPFWGQDRAIHKAYRKGMKGRNGASDNWFCEYNEMYFERFVKEFGIGFDIMSIYEKDSDDE